MVSFKKLAELSSGNVGFTGGTAVDTMPNMGLSECADAFSMHLMEAAIADYEREQVNDDMIFEAAMEAISSKDGSILEAAIARINEAEEAPAEEGKPADDTAAGATKKGALETIKAILKKIGDWLKNLTAKAKAWVDSKTKDGAEFWGKYKDKLNGSDIKEGVKVKGYDLAAAVDASSKLDFSVLPEEVISGINASWKRFGDVSGTEEELKELAGKLDAATNDDIKAATYKLMGLDAAKSVEEQLLGEAKERTIGTANVSAIEHVLVKFSAMPKSLAAYKKLNDANVAMERAASFNVSTVEMAYAKAYVKLYQKVMGEINKVMSALVKWVNILTSQAKKEALALMTGKVKEEAPAEPEKPAEEPKTEAVDLGLDEYEDFDL